MHNSDILQQPVSELVLMCGDTEVLHAYDSLYYVSVSCERLLPFQLKGVIKSGRACWENKDAMVGWLSSRVLPVERENFKSIVACIGAQQVCTNEYRARISLLCRAVSVSDNYWVKSNRGENVKWSDVNIRHVSLSEAVALCALHNLHFTIQGKIQTPEISTNGMCPKAWRRYGDGTLWLHKGSHGSGNEYLYDIMVSQILDCMNVDHVPYMFNMDNGRPVSTCPALTSDHLSIVDAWTLSGYYKRCFEDGSAKMLNIDLDSVNKMLVVDYILCNRDRHLCNWGYMYDPDSMRILGCHPLFDHNHAFDPMFIAFGESESSSFDRPGDQLARDAIQNVDIHLYKMPDARCFPRDVEKKTFMDRVQELGIKVIPETPVEMVTRLVKRTCMCMNRYDQVDNVMQYMKNVVGKEMSENDVVAIVQAVCLKVIRGYS